MAETPNKPVKIDGAIVTDPIKRHRRTAAAWTELVGARGPSGRSARSKVFAVGADPDHPTDQQASNGPQAAGWAKARARERDQCMKYKVFTKIRKEHIPEGTRIVDAKWVCLVKRRSDGTIEKHKARNVGRGFTQEDGINYDETYAQMMRPETFKILLVIAFHRDWAIRQWDVVVAYLQALLKHDVYVTDINEDGEVEYWKFDKALHGLKQACHEWFKTLCDIMSTQVEYGMVPTNSTQSLSGPMLMTSSELHQGKRT